MMSGRQAGRQARTQSQGVSKAFLGAQAEPSLLAVDASQAAAGRRVQVAERGGAQLLTQLQAGGAGGQDQPSPSRRRLCPLAP